mgnify:CR=1 FL=1
MTDSIINRRNMIAGIAGGGAGLAFLSAARPAQAASATAAPTVSAADFGAVGDGVADDTDALQRTFEAALDGDAATVVSIPPGRYRVTRPIEVVSAAKPDGDITHRAGILAQGARILSEIAEDKPVIRIESRAVIRFFLIEGLQINGSGQEGPGLSIDCETRGTYFYNFCLRDLVIESCGGDGIQLIGNLFEGQIFNSYFRDNAGHGAIFSHGAEDTVLSAVHVFGCVFGGNGLNGAKLIEGAADVSFHGCYFLLNQYYGLSAESGCTLLSHCGFENNHMHAGDFSEGNAGLRLMVYGTLIGCTAYSIYNQTHLIRSYITNRLVMIGCTADGSGSAADAKLANLQGQPGAGITLIGCYGGTDIQDGLSVLDLGAAGGSAHFGGTWDSQGLAWLGGYCLWVDGQGQLRMKKGTPDSDDDGQAVGASS